MTVGEKIKKLREKHALSKKALVRLIKFGGDKEAEDISILTKIEEGKEKPSEEIKKQLTDLFGVKEVYFATNFNIKEIDIMKGLTDKKYFIKKMCKLVNKSGLTKKALARKIGINYSTFGNYTQFNTSSAIPTPVNLSKICNYFGVKPEYFQKQEHKEEQPRKGKYYSMKELSEKYGVKKQAIGPTAYKLDQNGDINIWRKPCNVGPYGYRNMVHEDDIDKIYAKIKNRASRNKKEISNYSNDSNAENSGNNNENTSCLTPMQFHYMLLKRDDKIGKNKNDIKKIKNKYKELKNEVEKMKSMGFFQRLFNWKDDNSCKN